MSRLTSRGYSSGDATAFVDRSSRSHRRWKVTAHKWTEGAANSSPHDVPIVGGTLALDASDPVRRRLTLNVGGGGGTRAPDVRRPPRPVRSVRETVLRIDRDDGSWFPWLKMGEFHRVVRVREASQAATVEGVGLRATRRRVPLHLINQVVWRDDRHGRDQALMCRRRRLPDRAYAVRLGEGRRGKVTNYVAQAGDGRWSTATSIADRKGVETFSTGTATSLSATGSRPRTTRRRRRSAPTLARSRDGPPST
jgi:hypothetical protein